MESQNILEEYDLLLIHYHSIFLSLIKHGLNYQLVIKN